MVGLSLLLNQDHYHIKVETPNSWSESLLIGMVETCRHSQLVSSFLNPTCNYYDPVDADIESTAVRLSKTWNGPSHWIKTNFRCSTKPGNSPPSRKVTSAFGGSLGEIGRSLVVARVQDLFREESLLRGDAIHTRCHRLREFLPRFCYCTLRKAPFLFARSHFIVLAHPRDVHITWLWKRNKHTWQYKRFFAFIPNRIPPAATIGIATGRRPHERVVEWGVSSVHWRYSKSGHKIKDS